MIAQESRRLIKSCSINQVIVRLELPLIADILVDFQKVAQVS